MLLAPFAIFNNLLLVAVKRNTVRLATKAEVVIRYRRSRSPPDRAVNYKLLQYSCF